jgi:hypothetical protein
VTTVSPPPAALVKALEGAIDYAGLYPPASLAMAEAIDNYAAYLHSPDRWSLGRFVVPASRLTELTKRLATWVSGSSSAWRLSLTADSLGGDGLQAIRAAVEGVSPVRVEAVETRVDEVAGVPQLAASLPAGLRCYGEVPWDDRMESVLDALARANLAAKIRMGGTSAALFPEATRVVDFLEGARTRGLAFKATAGLHHPWRGCYRLTYEPGSPTATMFGYLNLTIAGLLVLCGAPRSDALEALGDAEPGVVTADDQGIGWRGHRFELDQLRRFRGEMLLAIGSCSFREPLDELRPALRL